MVETWAAIDFETATWDRASACAVGLVLVDGETVVDELHLLIRPPGNRYDSFNSALHGIGPGDTDGAASFADVWPEVEALLNGRTLVAHNAGFDFSVLRHEFAASGVTSKGLNYGCTLVLGRRHWRGLPSYSLPLLCDHVGVRLENHHDPLADARACAALAMALMSETGRGSFRELATHLGANLGFLGDVDRRCLAAAQLKERMPVPDLTADADHPFYGRCITFTGALSQWSRSQAAGLVAMRGGRCLTTVSGKTNFLVTGDQNPNALRGREFSGKARRAAELAARGQDIQILTEADFTRMLLA